MKKNTPQKYVFCFLALLLIAFSTWKYSTLNKNVSKEVPPTAVEENAVQSSSFEFKTIPQGAIPAVKPAPQAAITLVVGAQEIRLKIIPGQSLYQTLSLPENKGMISFFGKEYPGLGFFITDIGPLHQGNGQYLFYYVNGLEATAGISSYIPKNGDVVVWKLK